MRSPYAVRPLSARIRFAPGRVEWPRVQEESAALSAVLSRALLALVFAEHQDQRPAPPPGRLRFWTSGVVDDDVPGWVVVEDAEADAARGPTERSATRLVLSDVLTVTLPAALRAWLRLWWEEREVALDPSLGPQRQALRDAWARGAELILIQGDDHNLGRGLARWLHARVAPTLPLRPLTVQGVPELEPGGLWLWEQPQDEEPTRARRLTRTLDRALTQRLRPGTPAPLFGERRLFTPRPRPTDASGQPLPALAPIVGESPALIEALHQLVEHQRALSARRGSGRAILFTGPSGAGKELFAQAVIALCGPEQPAQSVNAATLSPALAAATLFGVERGVATGVAERVGVFELAQGGVLFIDEIGHLDLDTQAMLLRALDPGRRRRVGGREEHPVDLLLLAAADDRLVAQVEEGRFLPALWHRLATRRVQVPALADRLSDLPALIHHLSARDGDPSVEICPESLATLSAYPWPGNVRELAGVIETARAGRVGDERITRAHLSAAATRLEATRVIFTSAAPLHQLLSELHAGAATREASRAAVINVPTAAERADALAREAADAAQEEGRLVRLTGGLDDPAWGTPARFRLKRLLIGAGPTCRVFEEERLDAARAALGRALGLGRREPDRLDLGAEGLTLSRVHVVIVREDDDRLTVVHVPRARGGAEARVYVEGAGLVPRGERVTVSGELWLWLLAGEVDEGLDVCLHARVVERALEVTPSLSRASRSQPARRAAQVTNVALRDALLDAFTWILGPESAPSMTEALREWLSRGPPPLTETLKARLGPVAERHWSVYLKRFTAREVKDSRELRAALVDLLGTASRGSAASAPKRKMVYGWLNDEDDEDPITAEST